MMKAIVDEICYCDKHILKNPKKDYRCWQQSSIIILIRWIVDSEHSVFIYTKHPMSLVFPTLYYNSIFYYIYMDLYENYINILKFSHNFHNICSVFHFLHHHHADISCLLNHLQLIKLGIATVEMFQYNFQSFFMTKCTKHHYFYLILVHLSQVDIVESFKYKI